MKRDYDDLAVRLHCASAALVLLLFAMGRLTGLIPRGPARVDVWSAHLLIGLALAGVFAMRIAWRLKTPPLSDDPGPLGGAARWMHAALYGALGLVLVLGVINAFAHAFPLFNRVKLPQLGGAGFRETANLWHGTAANLLVALVSAHAAAAVLHHLWLEDRVLARMIPALREEAGLKRSQNENEA
ncbi:MAG TPA: cytochrome b/b6 domain-containing protein [Caulobacteraceae bacterium]|jgi:cytochrome b561